MKRILSILLCLMAFLAFGCTNEDDATVVAIFGTPSSYIVNCGDKIYIDITATTLNSTLTDISVTADHNEESLYEGMLKAIEIATSNPDFSEREALIKQFSAESVSAIIEQGLNRTCTKR